MLPPPECRTSSSSYGETAGIAAALSALNPPSSRDSYLIYTDSSAAVAVLNKQRTRSEALAQVARTIGKSFPYMKIEVRHIKGCDNIIADGLSRGRVPNAGEAESHAQELLGREGGAV